MWHLAFLVAGVLNTPTAPTPSALFERNLGQVDRRVAFLARGRSTSMSIAADGSFAITLGGTSPSRISIVPLGAATPRIDATERAQALFPPGFVFGWALDRADVDVTADGTPDGTGIEAVVVYAYPAAGGAPIFVCGPAMPYDRGDVAAIDGARFLKSGFAGCIMSNLTSGTYDLAVFAFSNRTRQYSPPVVVRFTKL